MDQLVEAMTLGHFLLCYADTPFFGQMGGIHIIDFIKIMGKRPFQNDSGQRGSVHLSQFSGIGDNDFAQGTVGGLGGKTAQFFSQFLIGTQSFLQFRRDRGEVDGFLKGSSRRI